MPITVVGGHDVKAYEDVVWKKVRRKFHIRDDFLADTHQFDFKWMDDGGGKGGNLMAFDRDRNFIVKELNGGDHAVLLRLCNQFSDHMSEPRQGSLLARFYMHFTCAEAKKLTGGTSDTFVVSEW